MRMHHMTRKITITALILLFPIIMALLIHFHGITVPYAEQWGLAPLLYKAHAGELGFSDLWAPHNEVHRILFPRAVMLALAFVSKWNLYCDLYTNFVLAVLTLMTLTALLRMSLQNSFSHWHTALLSAMVFSPTQYENFLLGWQITIFLSNFSVVAAVYFAFRFPGLKGLLLSSLAATVASFSFATGLLYGPHWGLHCCSIPGGASGISLSC
jgi:hypothetical protein